MKIHNLLILLSIPLFIWLLLVDKSATTSQTSLGPLKRPHSVSVNGLNGEYYNGVASFYDYDLEADDQVCRHNNCYSMFNSTCASRDYPRETMLHVATVYDSVICRVNDYGPKEETGRIIDLSSYAFKKLSLLSVGLLDVIVMEVQ